MAQQWEYKIEEIQFPKERVERRLYELGRNYWELIEVEDGMHGRLFFFKRPVVEVRVA